MSAGWIFVAGLGVIAVYMLVLKGDLKGAANSPPNKQNQTADGLQKSAPNDIFGNVLAGIGDFYKAAQGLAQTQPKST